MKSLKEFADDVKVFQDATDLPEFFDSNLVDPSRVVKAFLNDPNAHIRIYYYQYLKLCFEQENVNFLQYTKKIEDIINSSFKFYFYEGSDQQIFNDMQAKSFLMEFFGVIGQTGAGVEACLNKFPIMDQIFILFFRTILILFGKADSLDVYLPRDQILDTLNPYFSVDVQKHGDCITYTDSDIFVYELNPAAVYMAFMDDSKFVQVQQPEPTYIEEPAYVEVVSQKQNVIQTPQETLVVRPVSEKSNSGPAKDSYIAGQFMDYTAVTNNPLSLLNSKAKATLKSSGTLETFSTKPEPKVIIEVSTGKQQAKPIVESKKVTAEVSYQNQATISSSYGQSNNYAENNLILNSIKQASNKIDPVSNISNNWQSPIIQAPSNSFLPSSIKANENQFTQPQKPQITPVIIPPTDYGQYKQTSINQSSVSQTNQVNSYQNSQTNISQNNSQYGSFQTNQFNSAQINQPLSPQNNQFVPSQINQYPPPQLNQYGVSQNGQFDYLKQQQPPITPKNSAPEIKKEAPFYSPKQEPSYFSPLGYSSPKIEPITSEIKPSSSLTNIGKKKPFGLNVSEEFTNSLTMKSMAEPHRSNVQNMKSRARAFRSSLVNYIK